MPKGKRSSTTLHPERECGPCHMCHKSAYQYCHIQTWEETAKQRIRNIHPDIGDSDCVCRRCEKGWKRNVDRDGHAPNMTRNVCCDKCVVVGCTNKQSIIRSQVYTPAKIANILQCEVDSETFLVTSICSSHYKLLQRETSAVHKKCSLCHCHIHGKARHCTNPNIINQHYIANGITDVTISDKDLLCPACYNHYLNLVHQNQLHSGDDELRQLLESTTPPDIVNHEISLAMRDTIRGLGDVLLQGLGVLLPELYRHFISSALQQHGDDDVLNEQQVSRQLPKYAFLGYITSYFGKHMMWECKLRSCGILLYR